MLELGGCGRSYEKQGRRALTKTLSPVDGFPTGRTRLAQNVSLMPDAFHSGSRLEEVSEVVVTSKSPREVLALDEVVRHAPCDINRKDDGLIHLSAGELLN